MHNLRVWTIAYAPARTGNLERLQEIHRLNNEMWYLVSNALWKRLMALIAVFFITAKLMRGRFFDNGEKDSHDMSWRDVTSHM